ncbi:hypothetical protein ENBRE01_1824 [Enteropsectra breve]|nr:hypothetical protein ENBRE01_1824 [Enteropsectra breve]
MQYKKVYLVLGLIVNNKCANESPLEEMQNINQEHAALNAEALGDLAFPQTIATDSEAIDILLNQQAERDKQNNQMNSLADIKECIKTMTAMRNLIHEKEKVFSNEYEKQFGEEPKYDSVGTDITVCNYNVSHAVSELKKNGLTENQHPQNIFLLIQLYLLLKYDFNSKSKSLKTVWDDYSLSKISARAKGRKVKNRTAKAKAGIKRCNAKLVKIGSQIQSIHMLIDSIIALIKKELEDKNTFSLEVKYSADPTNNVHIQLDNLNKDDYYKKLGESQPLHIDPEVNENQLKNTQPENGTIQSETKDQEQQQEKGNTDINDDFKDKSGIFTKEVSDIEVNNQNLADDMKNGSISNNNEEDLSKVENAEQNSVPDDNKADVAQAKPRETFFELLKRRWYIFTTFIVTIGIAIAGCVVLHKSTKKTDPLV